MRIKGQVVEATYKKGFSQRTGAAYELTEYVMQAIDEQGHSHRMTFSMFGDKMREAAVHKGDFVELSYTLGIRTSQNGVVYNDVSSVYFVQKIDAEDLPEASGDDSGDLPF